jgi:lipoprotein-releasing system ATP-binding protein
MDYFKITDTNLTYSKRNVNKRFLFWNYSSREKLKKENFKIILNIKDLIIEDELVFVFGFSGSGKSTLLEALGLMNNTIVEGSSIIPTFEERLGNLEELWGKEKKEELYAARKDHYSFVFQSTVLLPNFTVVENVILPSLIEEGADYYRSYLKAVILLSQLNLEKLEVSKSENKVSGGQRQRLAFARAFLPQFSVLFGDEPTGNLDEINAEKLFNFLRFHIHDEQRCAIIVSHSIQLTLKYADKIILLTPKDIDNLGAGCIINPENVYVRTEQRKEHEKITDYSVDKIVNEIPYPELKSYIDSIKHEKEPKTMVSDVLARFNILSVSKIPDCSFENGTWRRKKIDEATERIVDDVTEYDNGFMEKFLRERLSTD